jgi:hypothetical protein
MQFQPTRALISRDNDDLLHDVPGMIPGEPEVGSPLRLFLESGKVMQTTAVQHVARHGSELVIDTMNSRYRLTLKN